MIFLSFPDFNIHSSPLLILVLQGLIFVVLLLIRYFKNRELSDLLLALVVLITCWHQTCYTIGFMGWYDENRTTKINYFLINQSLALAPLLYFYVKSITVPHFIWQRKDFRHFIPAVIYTLYKLFLYFYDAAQPGFADTQNGVLLVNFHWKYISHFTTLLIVVQMLLYLAFTLQGYFRYRSKISHVFSNTYDLELNWIRNFLLIYAFLFVYDVVEMVVELAIVDLHWTQEWWYYFFSALAIIYVGIKGYFTKTNKLNAIHLDEKMVLETANFSTVTAITKMNDTTTELPPDVLSKKQQLETYMLNEKPYLNPDLNLIELARSLNMNRGQLSEVINLGFQQNFNDFINQYRVEAVKDMLQQGRQKELSLLGIAYECGFNSKATFNRVFKKQTGLSPSQFITGS